MWLSTACPRSVWSATDPTADAPATAASSSSNRATQVAVIPSHCAAHQSCSHTTARALERSASRIEDPTAAFDCTGTSKRARSVSHQYRRFDPRSRSEERRERPREGQSKALACLIALVRLIARRTDRTSGARRRLACPTSRARASCDRVAASAASSRHSQGSGSAVIPSGLCLLTTEAAPCASARAAGARAGSIAATSLHPPTNDRRDLWCEARVPTHSELQQQQQLLLLLRAVCAAPLARHIASALPKHQPQLLDASVRTLERACARVSLAI